MGGPSGPMPFDQIAAPDRKASGLKALPQELSPQDLPQEPGPTVLRPKAARRRKNSDPGRGRGRR
ncbi:DUF6053 domain-containing protein [Lysobacter enzymogenes]|uniref:DUF6053 domain-containing protein n=1 Tax=Lysobacter enzymogenes TaxID=69 RepID=UPI003D189587